MAKRKTFDVQEFKEWVNARCLDAHFHVEHKHGLCNALDHVLLKTGNYKGFGYVYMDEQRPCLPGKVGAEACNPDWTIEHEYRRQYY
jgi:hypothetical protein